MEQGIKHPTGSLVLVVEELLSEVLLYLLMKYYHILTFHKQMLLNFIILALSRLILEDGI